MELNHLALMHPEAARIVSFLIAMALVYGTRLIYFRNHRHMPRDFRLRVKGLQELLAGRPAKAETLFRKSLAVAPPPQRVRALVCLGDALMDQGKYPESKHYLTQALALGDETGSGQGSMADLLLITRTDPEKAIEMADQGMQLSTGRSSRDLYFGGDVANDLRRARCWARTAQGLSQLNRKGEARPAIDRALRLTQAAETEAATVRPDTSVRTKLILGKRARNGRDLALATTHWMIGLALLSVSEPGEAAKHFHTVRITDKRGKYRRLAQQALDALDRGATPEVGHA